MSHLFLVVIEWLWNSGLGDFVLKKKCAAFAAWKIWINITYGFLGQWLANG